MRRLTRFLLAAALITSPACYRFEPVTVDAVPQGSRIRALLSPTATDRLRERHGIDSRQLVARVMAADGEVFSLWVPSVPVSPEFGVRPLYQQVEVAKSDVLRVDLRRLDSGKTAIIAVGGAAALVVVARATLLGGGQGKGGPPPPPAGREPPQVARPLIVRAVLKGTRPRAFSTSSPSPFA